MKLILIILLMKKYMCMVLIQSQEGGGPGHQRGSSTGAAGPGHEPQPAHLPGPGCRSHPGEGNILFTSHHFISTDTFGQRMLFCQCCPGPGVKIFLTNPSCLWQVEAGSRTVLAIMGEEEMVNNVTGSLKLL